MEHFPVGKLVAFDSWKGRLWAVCPSCRRWNLAPIEERWEPVEEAEKQFRDARLKATSENIGLAKLPDGTRLIRVGKALEREFAAWRYGDQLVSRRRRHLLLSAGVVAGIGAATFGASAFFGTYFAMFLSMHAATGIIERRRDRRVLHYATAEDGLLDKETSPVSALDLYRARLEPCRRGEFAVLVQGEEPSMKKRLLSRNASRPDLVIRGAAAERLLGRFMVLLNGRGANGKLVDSATWLLAAAGSPADYIGGMADRRAAIGAALAGVPLIEIPGIWKVLPQRKDIPKSVDLTPNQLLALEMALHEDDERRALEGELAALEAAWREAEEIAEIADGLLPVGTDEARA